MMRVPARSHRHPLRRGQTVSLEKKSKVTIILVSAPSKPSQSHARKKGRREGTRAPPQPLGHLDRTDTVNVQWHPCFLYSHTPDCIFTRATRKLSAQSVPRITLAVQFFSCGLASLFPFILSMTLIFKISSPYERYFRQ